MQRLSNTMLSRYGIYRHISSPTIFQPRLKKGLGATKFLLILLVSILITIALIVSSPKNMFPVVDNSTNKDIIVAERHTKIRKKVIEVPLNCTAMNLTQTCPTNYPTMLDSEPLSESICPDHFRWIYEDLRPWNTSGITRDMLEGAKNRAHFRLVIKNGKAYVVEYRKSIQSRDKFSIWGILQLLRKYPGMVPDLELMFDCDDRPIIKSRDYRGPNFTVGPPPLFRYCGDRWTLDIVFPDWSFWGWAEINIKPWESIVKDMKKGNNRTKWIDREPYAYWKGNPYVAETRRDLLTCNVTDKQDWDARLYIQDWILESKQGFKQSDVASQCTHRYKIYIEGWAWSVSQKYILACDSVTFIVKPHFYDFFTRSLQPVHHYWPIKENDKCKSIKFAVQWGNNHKQKAQMIGKAASEFMQEDLKMDNVYNYMFHLLNEYTKLMRFEPSIPEGAEELCSETMACPAEGSEKRFMMESMVKGPSITGPCTMPPPYDSRSLRAFVRRKENSIRQVENWENRYWESEEKLP